MSEPLLLLLAFLAGGALGGFFFGGLWWTVREVVSAQRPALRIVISLIIRTSAALFGFYLISDGRLDRLLLGLSGFVVARLMVTRLTEQWVEARHAP